ncbi:MAG: transcription termination/antitermination protein NusG [Faecalibacterium sp.]|nr:transcription termination/antitermination protein NusG [Ruminococcus sp.]MCM1392483.1 transcription termination/antitermination protein NusG [Ruminococcus sp.]MCM1485174.1 transcription termination/antitermination protein NusG [Faecalibacterium sp.]
MAENARWFVVHTYSGYENKVASNIRTVVENRQMQSEIFEVKIPTEIVKEIKDGREREVERKLFPGYVMVKVACVYKRRSETEDEELAMTDDAWYVIRNTRGVTGFVGPESKPLPLSEKEVIAFGIEQKRVEVNFKVGDLVNIVGGTLSGFSGIVDSIDLENEKVKVLISMFGGRETPTDVDLSDVEVVTYD